MWSKIFSIVCGLNRSDKIGSISEGRTLISRKPQFISLKNLIIILIIQTVIIVGQNADWNGDCELNILDITSIIECIIDDCWNDINVCGPPNFEMVTVPAGDYTFGPNDEILNINYDFLIMKYEVTNAQFMAYLEEALSNGDIVIIQSSILGYFEGNERWDAGYYEYFDLDDIDGRIIWTGIEFGILPGYENHPVVEVTWFGAYAFAQYYGMRLPTEYEWEKAARGNTGYEYPFGNNINGGNANFKNSADPFEEGYWAEKPKTTPVGFYNGQNYDSAQTSDSPSPLGAYDMAGNVWEFCDSWYSNTSTVVVRGGGWFHPINSLRSWYRRESGGRFGRSDIGFRCVDDL